MDLNTYRKFKEGDDVPFAEELVDTGKPWSYTNRRLIDLQKEFATQIWTHVNPYTGLANCDDPVWVLCEIVNEQDLDAFVILVSANEIIGEGFESTALTETVQDRKRKAANRARLEKEDALREEQE
jgi:hypothetical protein